MLQLVTAATLALMAQVAPSAASGASTPKPNVTSSVNAQPGAANDKPVCRLQIETGTRFSHRECHTAAQWNQISAEAKAQVEEYQEKASSASIGH